MRFRQTVTNEKVQRKHLENCVYMQTNPILNFFSLKNAGFANPRRLVLQPADSRARKNQKWGEKIAELKSRKIIRNVSFRLSRGRTIFPRVSLHPLQNFKIQISKCSL